MSDKFETRQLIIDLRWALMSCVSRLQKELDVTPEECKWPEIALIDRATNWVKTNPQPKETDI